MFFSSSSIFLRVLGFSQSWKQTSELRKGNNEIMTGTITVTPFCYFFFRLRIFSSHSVSFSSPSIFLCKNFSFIFLNVLFSLNHLLIQNLPENWWKIFHLNFWNHDKKYNKNLFTLHDTHNLIIFIQINGISVESTSLKQ